MALSTKLLLPAILSALVATAVAARTAPAVTSSRLVVEDDGAWNYSTALLAGDGGDTTWEPTQLTGCFLRPWICRNRPFPLSPMLCCRDICVNTTVDVNNCGMCGFQCPGTFSCCDSLCFNTNVNVFHCGRCFNRCPFGQLCILGICVQLEDAERELAGAANSSALAPEPSAGGP